MIFYALLSHFYANFSGFVQRSHSILLKYVGWTLWVLITKQLYSSTGTSGKFVVNEYFYCCNCGDTEAVMYPYETISIDREAHFNQQGANAFADDK